MANETERSGEKSADACDENGPLRGGKPIEPTPTDAGRHPTPRAEERAERVRKGEAAAETGEND